MKHVSYTGITLPVVSLSIASDMRNLLYAKFQYSRWSMSGPVTENYFSYFSTKTYVMTTQKNHHDETVLLSTKNTCLN